MLHVCPRGAPNVARIRWGERIFQKRRSLNLLSARRTGFSLPNKVLTSAGLSRLSVALKIECPIECIDFGKGLSYFLSRHHAIGGWTSVPSHSARWFYVEGRSALWNSSCRGPKGY